MNLVMPYTLSQTKCADLHVTSRLPFSDRCKNHDRQDGDGAGGDRILMDIVC
jgi:hypothetical protein